jgi:hypothetical protein
MVVPVGLIAGVAGNLLGGAAGGTAFEAALTAATSALGGGGGSSAQLQDKMIEAGVSVMGGMMMRLAGEVLNAGMEDDGE